MRLSTFAFPLYTFLMSLFALLMIFLTKYLVPLVFAIGLIYFLYGVIEYFVIGAGGDEERAEHGRDLFLKSIVWLILALVAQTIVLLLGWVSSLSLSLPGNTGVDGDGGITPRSNESILEVPDVPRR